MLGEETRWLTPIISIVISFLCIRTEMFTKTALLCHVYACRYACLLVSTRHWTKQCRNAVIQYNAVLHNEVWVNDKRRQKAAFRTNHVVTY